MENGWGKITKSKPLKILIFPYVIYCFAQMEEYVFLTDNDKSEVPENNLRKNYPASASQKSPDLLNMGMRKAFASFRNSLWGFLVSGLEWPWNEF